MPATTPDSLRYPVGGDTPNIPRDIKNLADDTQAALLRQAAASNIYANTAARNAAIPSPTEGQTCWLLDIHQQQAYYGGQWIPTGGVMPGMILYNGGGVPLGSANARLQFTFGGEAAYWGGVISPNGNNDGLYRVPVTGRYLVTLSCYLGANGAGAAAWGTWNTPQIWGGSSIGNANVASRPQLSHVVQHTAGSDYCFWLTMDVARTTYETRLTVAWVGAL